MSGFVVDASCVVAWLLEDESSAEADEYFRRIIAGENAWAPVLLRYEVANVLSMAYLKRERISQDDLRKGLQEFNRIPIQHDPECSANVTGITSSIAITRKLSVYDASYLELAGRKLIPLATLDTGMREAAKALGIEVI
ncbi:MAG: type II toxin-antitoxin system VapC family toxin [Verrucomicrobiota bacterium]